MRYVDIETTGAPVRVADLIGEDIKGRHAIVAQPVHRSLYPTGLPVNTLISVDRLLKADGAWLYLYFEEGCGYSGWREATYPDVTIEIL